MAQTFTSGDVIAMLAQNSLDTLRKTMTLLASKVGDIDGKRVSSGEARDSLEESVYELYAYYYYVYKHIYNEFDGDREFSKHQYKLNSYFMDDFYETRLGCHSNTTEEVLRSLYQEYRKSEGR